MEDLIKKLLGDIKIDDVQEIIVTTEDLKSNSNNDSEFSSDDLEILIRIPLCSLCICLIFEGISG